MKREKTQNKQNEDVSDVIQTKHRINTATVIVLLSFSFTIHFFIIPPVFHFLSLFCDLI